MSQDSRAVAQIVRPEPVIEGAGVHLRRSIGTRRLDHLDPFLLLDHFESARPEEYEPGFPYHPHRGIETVTFVRTGEIAHRDSLGHRGSIGAGDIQWMTSGSGILHEEMPQVRPEGIGGLQLWLGFVLVAALWTGLYALLAAAATMASRRAASRIWRIATGEAPPAKK